MMTVCFFVFLLASCTEDSPDEYVNPFPIDKTPSTSFTVEQHMLSNGQVIDIYIPPEYDVIKALPILYFNDGENFKYVFNRLLENYPEPFLMVGIYAGMERTDKYVPYYDPYLNNNTARSSAYSTTFVSEIIPFVENRFKTDNSRRGIFGMSFGGLHATWMGLKHPELFSFVAAMSPSYWVKDYALLSESVDQLTTANQFYFDMGTEEWNYYVPFIERLESAGLSYGNEIFYYEVFGGGHTGTDWERRIHIPFSLFLSQGNPTGAVSYELFVECIPSLGTPGLTFRRLNPVINFGDGTKYSLTTEASYEIIDGDGIVTPDGRFEVSSGTMKVRVSFDSWSEEVNLTNCS